MYAITGRGLQPLARMQLQENTRYYLGASDTPDRIVVLRVTPERVTYQRGGADKPTVTDRRSAEHLIRTGCETWLRRHPADEPGFAEKWKRDFWTTLPNWMVEEARHLRAVLAGQPVKPENLSDWDRLCVLVRAADGVPREEYPRGDAWYLAEYYGNVGGIELDGVPHYEIDYVTGAAFVELQQDSKLVIVEVKSRHEFGKM